MFITQAETTYQKAHFGHTGPIYTHLPPRPRVSRAPPRGYALACIFALATEKTCRYSPLSLRSRYIVSIYCIIFNYFLLFCAVIIIATVKYALLKISHFEQKFSIVVYIMQVLCDILQAKNPPFSRVYARVLTLIIWESLPFDIMGKIWLLFAVVNLTTSLFESCNPFCVTIRPARLTARDVVKCGIYVIHTLGEGGAE